jgi:hypothetical protein
MRLNVRASLLVILFAAGLTVFVTLGIQNDWGIFRRPTQEQIENLEAKNPAAFEDGAVDFASVDLHINIIPPSSSEEARQVTFELERLIYYLRDDNPDVDIAEACIDDVRLMFIPPDAPENVDGGYFFFDPICVTPLPEEFIADEVEFTGSFTIDNYYEIWPEIQEPFKLNITDHDTVSLNFWYPYDNFRLNTVIQVTYRVVYSDGTEAFNAIEPFVAWNIQTSGTRLWDVRLNAAQEFAVSDDFKDQYLYMIDGVFNTIGIAFERPLLYRLVFPFFMMAMVLLISLVPLLGERDTLVDISAAMLFGIFGLKGILGPGEQMGQTVLDIALIGLYVLLAFAAFLFFINRLNLHRQEQTTEATSEQP